MNANFTKCDRQRLLRLESKLGGLRSQTRFVFWRWRCTSGKRGIQRCHLLVYPCARGGVGWACTGCWQMFGSDTPRHTSETVRSENKVKYFTLFIKKQSHISCTKRLWVNSLRSLVQFIMEWNCQWHAYLNGL